MLRDPAVAALLLALLVSPGPDGESGDRGQTGGAAQGAAPAPPGAARQSSARRGSSVGPPSAAWGWERVFSVALESREK